MIKERSKQTVAKEKFQVDFDVMKKAALMLRAVNHKLRQQILALINKSGEITVSEIYAKLKLEQSVTSSHLAILRKAGLVNTKRNGQSISYSVNYSRLSQVEKSAKTMLK